MFHRSNVNSGVNGLGSIFTNPFNNYTDPTLITLKGKIIDGSTNEPLSPANIYYTKNNVKFGVITNTNGEYELQAAPEDIVTISFLGYDNIEAPANQIQSIEYLYPKYEQLNEVIVNGPKKTKDNTMLYVGVGLLALIVIAASSQEKDSN